MKSVTIIPLKKPDPYLMEIVLLENDDVHEESRLPFFADGYPGIMYQSTVHGIYQQPLNKQLSNFLLYGQTIAPIELVIKGSYKLVVFQLFPSAVKALLKINPKELNDNCYDLTSFNLPDGTKVVERLQETSDTTKQVEVISSFLRSLSEQNGLSEKSNINHAINLILDSRGKISIKNLRERLNISERTFERQFLDHVGVSPKQFARIIQFQLSLNTLTEENYIRLTDIAFENGFADQSHFIRAFKQFTGKTPLEFQKQIK